MSTPPPRRFYKHAAATPERGVALDERALRTPGGALFIAPTAALARAAAHEWNAQGERISLASMPLTQLAFAAIDRTANNRAQQIDYIAAYAETDLVAHRADAPGELVARQAAAWDPLVAWLGGEFGIALPVVTGVIAAPPDAASRAAVRRLADEQDDFRLTALAQATGLSGSVAIGFALLDGLVTPGIAFQAAALDNLWSLERWGEDAEARAKLDRQRAEFENIARFIALLS